MYAVVGFLNCRGKVAAVSRWLQGGACLLLMLGSAHAQVVCSVTADPELRALEGSIGRDAVAALARMKDGIAELERAPRPDPLRLASLHALEAQSYTLLELDAEARAAASRGLALVPQRDHPVHVALRMAYAGNVYDQSGLEQAIADVELTRRAQAADSPADVCLRIQLGQLQMRTNHLELAVATLTQAYRTAELANLAQPKVAAAAVLSSVMRLLGDFDQALTLNQEVIDWVTARSATLSLSVARFMRGAILAEMRDFGAAFDEYTKARALSMQVNDRQGVAFADANMCLARTELGQLQSARTLCNQALRAMAAQGLLDMVKDVRTRLARIDLEEGRAELALATLDSVLDQRGADIAARLTMTAYRLRSQANAALGRYADAYADVSEYVQRYTEANDAMRVRDATMLRIRFELTSKESELIRAQAEARAARLEVSQQALVRNLVVVSAASLLSAALFSAWIWSRRRESANVLRATEERVAAIGRLTGGVAHEFNNLLTVIQQATGLLARRIDPTDRGAENLVAEIQQSTEVCAQITTQLLSISRQQNLQPENIDVDGFLAVTQSVVEKIAGEISVDISVAAAGLSVRADRRQLTATLLNLIANARDAMDKEGAVTLRASDDGDFVRFEVIDTGCGMTADVLAHAVEPFFTTKPVGEGSGLGLSVVDGFARQSGGALTIDSTPGHGTRVSLRLPKTGVAE